MFGCTYTMPSYVLLTTYQVVVVDDIQAPMHCPTIVSTYSLSIPY
jgi:hypothetical protein